MPTFSKLELHRQGIGLVPAPGRSVSPIHIEGARPLRSCTCTASKRKTCKHLKALSAELARFHKHLPRRTWGTFFAATPWYRLARLLFDERPLSFAELIVDEVPANGDSHLRLSSPRGEVLASYLAAGPGRQRLLERFGKAVQKNSFVDRAGILERLALFQMTAAERQLSDYGAKTVRQAWEESFWHRLAYHCVREFQALDEPVGPTVKGGAFRTAIDETSGYFLLTFGIGDDSICRLTVPPRAVEAALKLLSEVQPEPSGTAIDPSPLRSALRVTRKADLDLEVRPMVRAFTKNGGERLLDRREKFLYGRLVFLPELDLLARLEDGNDRDQTALRPATIQQGQLPAFLHQHRQALADGTLRLDEELSGLEVYSTFEWLEMRPEAGPPATSAGGTIDRGWYRLSVRYGFGNQAVSLADILAARRRGESYLETAGGWIDLASDAFDALDEIVPDAPQGGRHGLRLTASQVLRLQAQSGRTARIAGSKGRAAVLRRLLDLRPSRPLPPLAGLASDDGRTPLRPYQELGVDWLRFLFENRLGGLLCDDMGLGKTHQAMALMVALREELGEEKPFLVVTPTSVLSHWRNKIRDHAPGLTAVVHHGPDRDLEAAVAAGDVVLTSYGILRRDLEELGRRTFALAIFDEIQYLKNRGTLGYLSAQAIVADVKLGLTGTPIENRVEELKALFDLVLPGYLGTDKAFLDRYGEQAPRGPASPTGDPVTSNPHLGQLRRLISPFVLRRLKSTVLDELPGKIEDLRTCTLSDDQVKLYRDALSTRGRRLVAEIEAGLEPLPYIHVFALLNLLKQICDHPALALRQLDRAGDYASGKWDLYCELLRECLDSGHKVVVFSQYLGMIELMKRHLGELGVESAVLTGASVRRGEIVARFNDDPACRVFLGSLKAGGTGIDLVGGSVVIHYDRWWNAAREDQATDRVHRIGQKRAVQVFKLVTEGTLEEKIGAIIERKRRLMAGVVEEDDPGLKKIFNREEILELLCQEV